MYLLPWLYGSLIDLSLSSFVIVKILPVFEEHCTIVYFKTNFSVS